MRKRISGLVIGLICCTCLWNGCQNEVTGQNENFAVVNNARTQVKNEGIFYIDGYTEMMKFYDFKLAQSIPICDRPNCEHNSSGCNAYLPQGFMSGMGCYRDKLYYYDNMSSGLPFYQCDKNGSNRKMLTKLNGDGNYEGLMVELPMFFVENEVIFRISYSHFLSEVREDDLAVNQEKFWTFGKVNLESGTFEIIKEPEKLDDGEWIDMGDYINGNIFYTKSGGIREHHKYDLENGKDILLFTPDEGEISYLGMAYDIQKAIYMTQRDPIYNVYTLDIKTGERESVFQKKAAAGKELYLNMEGERLYYCVYKEGEGTVAGELFGVYDFTTKEEKELTKEEYWYGPSIAETDDWYVGHTEDGTVCIPKDAYYKKDWSKVQIIGSF